MKFKIELTWSKFIALLVLMAAVWLDIENGSINAFMFALPFIIFLITGKQYLDRSKPMTAPVEIPGCTDPKANNFNAAATIDNGSCKYNAVP